jgi:putative acetyltransferase
MISTRKSVATDGARIMDIWRRAVDATHDFLSFEDRRSIEAEAAAFLPGAPLDLAVDDANRAIGFMLLHGSHMEALFVDPEFRGSGIGRALVEDAVKRHPNLTTDVNEQNPQAIGFYERLGFERCGRSAMDGQGRPYPLIHLRYAKVAQSPTKEPHSSTHLRPLNEQQDRRTLVSGWATHLPEGLRA